MYTETLSNVLWIWYFLDFSLFWRLWNNVYGKNSIKHESIIDYLHLASFLLAFKRKSLISVISRGCNKKYTHVTLLTVIVFYNNIHTMFLVVGKVSYNLKHNFFRTHNSNDWYNIVKRFYTNKYYQKFLNFEVLKAIIQDDWRFLITIY